MTRDQHSPPHETVTGFKKWLLLLFGSLAIIFIIGFCGVGLYIGAGSLLRDGDITVSDIFWFILTVAGICFWGFIITAGYLLEKDIVRQLFRMYSRIFYRCYSQLINPKKEDIK